jgi:hypothetical protein
MNAREMAKEAIRRLAIDNALDAYPRFGRGRAGQGDRVRSKNLKPQKIRGSSIPGVCFRGWRSITPEAAPGGRLRPLDWARILVYVTGMVDQELPAPNACLADENRILRAHPFGGDARTNLAWCGRFRYSKIVFQQPAGLPAL